jgi:hypothetical protein
VFASCADSRGAGCQAREPDAAKNQIPELLAALTAGGAGPEVARAVRCAARLPLFFVLQNARAGGKARGACADAAPPPHTPRAQRSGLYTLAGRDDALAPQVRTPQHTDTTAVCACVVCSLPARLDARPSPPQTLTSLLHPAAPQIVRQGAVEALQRLVTAPGVKPGACAHTHTRTHVCKNTSER